MAAVGPAFEVWLAAMAKAAGGKRRVERPRRDIKRKRSVGHPPIPILAGQRFGRLVVVEDRHLGPPAARYVWVRCDCGTEKWERQRVLQGEPGRSGRSQRTRR